MSNEKEGHHIQTVLTKEQICEAAQHVHSIVQRDVFSASLGADEMVTKAMTVYLSYVLAVQAGIEGMMEDVFESDDVVGDAAEMMDTILTESKRIMRISGANRKPIE